MDLTGRFFDGQDIAQVVLVDQAGVLQRTVASISDDGLEELGPVVGGDELGGELADSTQFIGISGDGAFVDAAPPAAVEAP